MTILRYYPGISFLRFLDFLVHLSNWSPGHEFSTEPCKYKLPTALHPKISQNNMTNSWCLSQRVRYAELLGNADILNAVMRIITKELMTNSVMQ